jgi:hypothetical protein
MLVNIVLLGFIPFGVLLGLLMFFAESGSYKDNS